MLKISWIVTHLNKGGIHLAQAGILFTCNCFVLVIPAEAGIQCSLLLRRFWTPAFAGVTVVIEHISLLLALSGYPNLFQ